MPSCDSDPEHGIYRVQYIGKLGDSWMACISDLIFLDGEPHVVLDWAGPPDRQHPLVMQKLDPQRLVTLQDGAVDFLYDGQIADPRKQN